MGVSVSASALIFFISFAICLSMAFNATEAYFEDIHEAQSETAEDIDARLNTAVRMDRAYYNSTTKVLEINATNTGSITIDTALLDIVVDGVLKTGNITKVETGGYAGGLWYPASSVRISLKGIDPPSRVKLSTLNGACCYTSEIDMT